MKVLFHFLRAAWLFQIGRWYVWRDTPHDVVRLVSAMWYYARKEPPSDFTNVIYEAHKEYKLRKIRNKQTGE